MASNKVSIEIELLDRISGNLDRVNQKMDEMGRTTQEAKDGLAELSGASDSLKESLAALGAAFSMKELVGKVISVRGEMQQLQIAFETMLGSAEKAQALMDQLVHTAAVTPFGLEDVANGARQLLAYGTQAEKVNETLIKLGDIAAGLSMPLNDLVYLYGTTMTQGRLYTQDLNQFTGRGIPMIRELAKQFGVAEDKVKGLVEAGKVGFEEVEKVIDSLAGDGGMFGGLMEAQSQTITGKIANIEDAIDMMMNDIGERSEGIINGALDSVSYLVENYEKFGRILLSVAATWGAYRTALMLATAASGWASAAEAIHYNWLLLVEKAQKLLNATMLKNPYVLAATAIVGVVSALWAAASAASAAEQGQAAYNDEMERMNQEAENRKNTINGLVNTIRNAESTSLEKQLAFNELKDLAPELTEVYDSVQKIADADLGKFNEQMNELADAEREQTLRDQVKEMQDVIKTIQDFQSAGNQASQDNMSKLRGAMAAISGMGIEGSWTWGYDDYIEAVQARLSPLMDELSKIEKAKEQIAEPTEVDVKLAEEDYERAKAKVDTLSDFMVAMTERQVELRIDGSSVERADIIIEEIAGKAEALRKEQEENPIAFTSDKQKSLDEYEDMLREMRQWKEDAEASGDTAIPFWFQFDYDRSLQERDRAKSFAQTIQDAVDANKSTTTYGDAYTAAQTAYNNAQKEYNRIQANRQAYTQQQFEDAKSTLETATKNFKDLGGDVTKSTKNAENKRKQEEQKRKRAEEQLGEALRSLQQQNTESEIALMQEGAEKKRREIQADYDKRMAEIKKQEEKLKKLNQTAKAATGADGLTDEQRKALHTATEQAERQRLKAIDDANREALESMRDYIAEYGSLEQQKLAITEEYEEKIAKAKDKWEARRLEKEREAKLSALTYENISAGMDWKSLLSGVGSLAKEMMGPMMDKLVAYTQTEDYRTADTQTQQKVAELIQQLREYLGTDPGYTWQSLGEAMARFSASTAAYERAQQAEQTALTQLAQAADDLASGRIGQDAYDLAKATADAASAAVVAARERMQGDGTSLNNQAEQVKNYVSPLTAALNNCEALKNLDGFTEIVGGSQQIDSLKGALDAVLPGMEDGLGKSIGSGMSSVLGKGLSSIGSSLSSVMSSGLGSLVGILAQIPQVILQLADTIKNFVTGILDSFSKLLKFEWLSELVNSILEAVGNLIDTILDLPENLWHMVSSIVVDGIGGLLNTVVGRIGNILSLGALSSAGPASWFTNSNAQEVADTIDRLTERNEILTTAIDKLTDELGKTSGMKAVENAQKAEELQREKEQNLKEMAQAQASYVGAHHSWNAYWGGFSQEQTDALSKQMGRSWNGDLWDLSADEMALLLSNPDMVEAIRNTGKGGYGDRVLERLQDYADEAGELQDIVDTLNESLTQTTFDSLRSDFLSTLMDMDSSAEDFADNFSEMLMQSVLNAKMADLMDDELEAFYKEWAERSKDGLSEEDIAALQEWWNRLTEQGLQLRDEVSAITGYTGSGSSQSGKSGAFTTMTQDQGTKLEGMFTSGLQHWSSMDARLETVAERMATAESSLARIAENTGLSAQGVAELKEEFKKMVRDGLKVK